MAKKKGKKRFKGMVSRNAQKQQRGASYGHLNLPKGLSVFKEEPGSRVNLDILPYEVTAANHPDRDDEYEIAIPGSLWYKRPYWLHRNIGPDNQSIVCPSSIGQKCPICEYRAQLLKDGARWDDDAVKALKPSMRNLYVVIPKGSKKYEETLHIWDISQFLFQDKLNEEIQENEEYETFPDLEEGYTLRIRFSEESFGGNKFAETSRIDFKERSKPYDEAILEEIPSLDEILEIPSYKTIEAMFFGGMEAEEAEDDDEEEEKPTRRQKPVKSKPEPEPDPDDDDEERDEPDEDDDDEERDEPDEDDDDEEEEEEDDEEEEKPVKKPPVRTKKQETKKPKKPEKKGGKCPHGHKFGEDCEEYDECDDCDKWEECMDASGRG